MEAKWRLFRFLFECSSEKKSGGGAGEKNLTLLILKSAAAWERVRDRIQRKTWCVGPCCDHEPSGLADRCSTCLGMIIDLGRSKPVITPPLTSNTVQSGIRGTELTITSPYVDSNTFIYHGQPLPESTLALCQSRLHPPVRDLGFGLWSGWGDYGESGREEGGR
jgi:hypothetical protein